VVAHFTSVGASQQHVPDVMTGAVVELEHVELAFSTERRRVMRKDQPDDATQELQTRKWIIIIF